MSLPYKIVVGLEVHVQLLTNTKLFCGCSTKFGSPPNSQVCPVCIGMPGTLPVMNRKAFDLALRAALALNCSIAEFTKWDRKNYYYPDLPKNYQISQYDLPFSYEGFLEINAAADPKKEYTPKRIGLFRAHLEEDAGKNTHDESGRGADSKVDLNRTGTPLLEIVSKPEINSPEEAKAYLEEIRLMLREIGVSDCEMQEGSLRCDANVNIHIEHEGGIAATPLVEVKNLNSITSVGRAIAYEAERQYKEFKKDPVNYRFGNMFKTTAGWNDVKGITVIQRHKENASDYRYFPEPDLVPVVVTPSEVQAAKMAMGELPSEQRKRLQSAPFNLTQYDSQVLTAKGRRMVTYYEEVTAVIGDGKQVINRMSDLVMGALNDRKEEIDQFPLSSQTFADFMKKTASITQQGRRDVFNHMLEKGTDAATSIKELGIQTDFDESKLLQAVLEAIAANGPAVEDYKKGKTAAANRIKGHVMKTAKGAPNDVVQRLLEAELAKLMGT
ncbi:Asp-tRNA(Asn)/Glu-tRNA(Gln) amidotransferase subunit GatB [Zavarzinella formosa]|uniref:Asp-tRNA(Asn)/Glu-tRNA(Gln) amidotransferase subunit GatB n=1 Tax=Zavarzinella formosa TaxID=360055 RepID=UPI00035FED37|nr:Asp-tRNA(Asn)/Glu-tRNA(Gln) amidotransferase subunit GatB [Zavarzinella formosa]